MDHESVATHVARGHERMMKDPVGRVLAELYPTPTWFPQALDSTLQWVRMLRFNEEDFRAAPFLDRRGLRKGMRIAVLPFERLAQRTPANARRDAHWIFHISHVGSTLISRLLGEANGVLALREPLLLRSLTAMDEAGRREHIPVIRALLSRTFGEGQRAMVKATSYLSEYAASLVGPTSGGGKALMVRMAPERFIAARLSGSPIELRARTHERLARLMGRGAQIDQARATIDDAHRAAAAWAAETSAIEAAADHIAPERVHFLDFERFLDEPVEQFAALAQHFDIAASPELLAGIIGGPLISRNAKNSAVKFDTAVRDERIASQLTEHRTQIDAAMRWLGELGDASPLIGKALARSGA